MAKIYGQVDPLFLLMKAHKKVANDKIEHGYCQKCRFAFRPDYAQLFKFGTMLKRGAVLCGRYEAGSGVLEIPDVTSYTCHMWNPRQNGQPDIGDPRDKQGEAFNRKVMTEAQKIRDAGQATTPGSRLKPTGWGKERK